MLINLKNADISEKTVLLRVDYNVPVEYRAITDITRIVQSLETINYCLKQNAKIVLLSHMGRPKGTSNPKYSLFPVYKKLVELLPNTFIKFIDENSFDSAQEIISKMDPSSICMLENLRFHPGEETCCHEFGDFLASLGDYYINDAFSVSHRKHASVYAVPQLLPSSAGINMQKEIQALDYFLKSPEAPVTCIIGGSKLSTKLPVIKNIISKVNTIILGGQIATIFAMVIHKTFGEYHSETIREYRQEVLKTINIAQENNVEIIIPTDFTGEINGYVQRFDVQSSLHEKATVLDIGPQTIENIKNVISQSKVVLWNGPVGLFEKQDFSIGTRNIAESISVNTSSNNIKSIVGGGETVAAMNKFSCADSVTYLSTSGGAFLEYLEGKLLPGVEALTIRSNAVCSTTSLSQQNFL